MPRRSRRNADTDEPRREPGMPALGLAAALLLAVPAVALVCVRFPPGAPGAGLGFVAGDDPYRHGLRITDRRVAEPRAEVGTSPVYEGQDEIAALLNDWQLADNPTYFAAR